MTTTSEVGEKKISLDFGKHYLGLVKKHVETLNVYNEEIFEGTGCEIGLDVDQIKVWRLEEGDVIKMMVVMKSSNIYTGFPVEIVERKNKCSDEYGVYDVEKVFLKD